MTAITVVLIAMFYQSIVGISAGLFQAFKFFQRQWKLISEPSSKASLSIRKERNPPLVFAKKFVARFAFHGVPLSSYRVQKYGPWAADLNKHKHGYKLTLSACYGVDGSINAASLRIELAAGPPTDSQYLTEGMPELLWPLIPGMWLPQTTSAMPISTSCPAV